MKCERQALSVCLAFAKLASATTQRTGGVLSIVGCAAANWEKLKRDIFATIARRAKCEISLLICQQRKSLQIHVVPRNKRNAHTFHCFLLGNAVCRSALRHRRFAFVNFITCKFRFNFETMCAPVSWLRLNVSYYSVQGQATRRVTCNDIPSIKNVFSSSSFRLYCYLLSIVPAALLLIVQCSCSKRFFPNTKFVIRRWSRCRCIFSFDLWKNVYKNSLEDAEVRLISSILFTDLNGCETSHSNKSAVYYVRWFSFAPSFVCAACHNAARTCYSRPKLSTNSAFVNQF